VEISIDEADDEKSVYEPGPDMSESDEDLIAVTEDSEEDGNITESDEEFDLYGENSENEDSREETEESHEIEITGDFESEDQEDTDRADSYSEVLAGFGSDISDSEETPEEEPEETEDTEITGDFELTFDTDETEEEYKGSGMYAEALAGFGVDETEEDMVSIETQDAEEDIESDFTGGDIFEGDEEEEELVESAAPEEKEPVSEEDDFLGLGSISDEGGDEGGRFGGTVEIHYEGVEMEFDDQISKVTLAEVLLAQGEKEEALSLLRDVEEKKGVTRFVADRLRKLEGRDADATPDIMEE